MAFLVKMLGCSPDTTRYTVLCVLLLRFDLPGKWPVYCIGSNISLWSGSFCHMSHGEERELQIFYKFCDCWVQSRLCHC